jgi:hypothetical protein
MTASSGSKARRYRSSGEHFRASQALEVSGRTVSHYRANFLKLPNNLPFPQLRTYYLDENHRNHHNDDSETLWWAGFWKLIGGKPASFRSVALGLDLKRKFNNHEKGTKEK